MKPFNVIISSPSERARETAAQFGKFQENSSLEGWARGSYEGQPVDSVKDEMAHLIMNPDEIPPGISPVSGNPGQSWNEMAKPLFADVRRTSQKLWQFERGLMVTSGGNLQAIDAWGKAGYPADYEFNRSEMAAQPYWSVTGEIFRLGDHGLSEVKDNSEPGLYLIEHGETEWNQKAK